MMKVVSTNIETALADLYRVAIKAAFPQLSAVPDVLISQGKVADFQCNNAMGLAKLLSSVTPPVKMSPPEIGKALVSALPPNDLIDSCEPTGAGFINISIRKEWCAEAVHRVVTGGVKPPAVERQRVLIDFSSPNIAKEMHVGHLRSTIIGECLSRLFEFCGHEVRRINHVGDWGTQFGMLILYLKQNFPNFQQNMPDIKDLVEFYKKAKKQFDEDAAFKEQARLEVVELQRHNPESIAAWKVFCDLSRVEFEEIYNRLGVHIEERGESFYNPYIPEVLKLLEDAGQIQVSDGAQIIMSTKEKPVSQIDEKDLARLLSNHLVLKKKNDAVAYNPVLLDEMQRVGVLAKNDKGEEVLHFSKKEFKKWAEFNVGTEMEKLAKALHPLLAKPALSPVLAAELKKVGAFSGENIKVPRFSFPLMARKSDGGYTYDTTDLAAIHHRFVVEKYQRVIYITDVGQFEHFNMVAATAQDMGWLRPPATWDHAGFGLVSGADGKKLKTRSGDTTKLKDLLDEAVDRAYENLVAREAGDSKQGHSEDDMRRLSKIIGYGAVKYFDLKQNRTTDYSFSYDKMLDFNGNTAVFLLYSYARICSIKRKAGVTAEQIAAGIDMALTEPSEKNVALAALRFDGVVRKTMEDLFPHHLTDFAYDLVGAFNTFYQACPVVGSPQQMSRLQLCELVGVTLKKTLEILSIDVAERL